MVLTYVHNVFLYRRASKPKRRLNHGYCKDQRNAAVIILRHNGLYTPFFLYNEENPRMLPRKSCQLHEVSHQSILLLVVVAEIPPRCQNAAWNTEVSIFSILKRIVHLGSYSATIRKRMFYFFTKAIWDMVIFKSNRLCNPFSWIGNLVSWTYG